MHVHFLKNVPTKYVWKTINTYIDHILTDAAELCSKVVGCVPIEMIIILNKIN